MDFLILLLLISSVRSEVDLGLKSFTCNYLYFNVSYDIKAARLININELLVNCSDSSQLYQVGNNSNLNYHMDGTEQYVLYTIAPPVPESSKCYLEVAYSRIITIYNVLHYYIRTDLSCELPKTEVSCTPTNLIMNSSSITINSSTTIECHVKSSSYVPITWLQNEHRFEPTDGYNITNTFKKEKTHYLSISILHFSSPWQSYSGLYECVSNKTISNDIMQANSTACRILVAYSPEIQELPRTAATNKNVTLDIATDLSTNRKTENAGNMDLIIIVAILASAVVASALCAVAVILSYCIWIKRIKSIKLSGNILATIYPSELEIKQLTVESLTLPYKNVSDSTPSVFDPLHSHQEPKLMYMDEILMGSV